MPMPRRSVLAPKAVPGAPMIRVWPPIASVSIASRDGASRVNACFQPLPAPHPARCRRPRCRPCRERRSALGRFLALSHDRSRRPHHGRMPDIVACLTHCPPVRRYAMTWLGVCASQTIPCKAKMPPRGLVDGAPAPFLPFRPYRGGASERWTTSTMNCAWAVTSSAKSETSCIDVRRRCGPCARSVTHGCQCPGGIRKRASRASLRVRANANALDLTNGGFTRQGSIRRGRPASLPRRHASRFGCDSPVRAPATSLRRRR